jgi:hypothetical protein
MTRTTAVLVAGVLSALLATRAAAGELPDVIRFKNGAMVRGTIVEMVPGDRVEIVTASGEKRVYRLADVEYAGAVATPQPRGAEPSQPPPPPPGSPPPPTTVPAPGAFGGGSRVTPVAPSGQPKLTLHVTSDDPGLRLHERTFSTAYSVGGWGWGAPGWGGPGWGLATRASAYSDLCVTPCDLSLSPGSYALAVSRGTGGPVEGNPVFIGPQARELHATYLSRSGTRVAGWILWGLGLAAGVIMESIGLANMANNGWEGGFTGLDLALVLGGGAAAIVGTTVGLILIRAPDRAAFDVQ